MLKQDKVPIRLWESSPDSKGPFVLSNEDVTACCHGDSGQSGAAPTTKLQKDRCKENGGKKKERSWKGGGCRRKRSVRERREKDTAEMRPEVCV